MKYTIPFQIIYLTMEDEKNKKQKSKKAAIDTGCHLIVEAELENGNKINLIVDTGASQSVFDTKMLHKSVQLSNFQVNTLSSGVNANIDIKLGIINFIKFNELEISNMQVGLTDLSHVNGLYKQFTSHEITGLLGGDFLLKHKAIINYKKSEITVNCPKKRKI